MSKFDELRAVYDAGRAYEQECVQWIRSGVASIQEYLGWPDAAAPMFLHLDNLPDTEREAAFDPCFAINNHGSVRGALRLQLDTNDPQSIFDLPVTMFRSEKGWVMSLGSSSREVLSPEGKLPPETLESAFVYVRELVQKRFLNPSPPDDAKA